MASGPSATPTPTHEGPTSTPTPEGPTPTRSHPALNPDGTTADEFAPQYADGHVLIDVMSFTFAGSIEHFSATRLQTNLRPAIDCVEPGCEIHVHIAAADVSPGAESVHVQANVTVDPVWTNAKVVLADIETFTALSVADQSKILFLDLAEPSTAVEEPVQLLASGKINLKKLVRQLDPRAAASDEPWTTSSGPTVCTDVDLNMGTPTRSAFGGLCCTHCGDDICCPSKDIGTGEDITLTLRKTG